MTAAGRTECRTARFCACSPPTKRCTDSAARIAVAIEKQAARERRLSLCRYRAPALYQNHCLGSEEVFSWDGRGEAGWVLPAPTLPAVPLWGWAEGAAGDCTVPSLGAESLPARGIFFSSCSSFLSFSGSCR